VCVCVRGGGCSTQLGDELGASLQMSKLSVNASGESFALVEVFPRNPRVLRSTVWQTLPYRNITSLFNFAQLQAATALVV
jgi:hypothetical protein